MSVWQPHTERVEEKQSEGNVKVSEGVLEGNNNLLGASLPPDQPPGRAGRQAGQQTDVLGFVWARFSWLGA